MKVGFDLNWRTIFTLMWIISVCINGVVTAQDDDEGEGEIVVEIKNFDLYLKTGQSYNLPVLPSQLTENLEYTYIQNNPDAFTIQIWMYVVHRNPQDLDNSMQLIVNGNVRDDSLLAGVPSNAWIDKTIDIDPTEDTIHRITLTSTFHTGTASKEPTMVLIGAILVGPGDNDVLSQFHYSANLPVPGLQLEKTPDGSTFFDSLGISNGGYYARLGGLTSPRIAISFRHELIDEEDGEGEVEGEPVIEGEGEEVTSGNCPDFFDEDTGESIFDIAGKAVAQAIKTVDKNNSYTKYHNYSS